jgi:hypothetical protein
VLYLRALNDQAGGKDVELPAPPLAYVVMLWRRKMHVGYFEAMRTPFEVIATDLEMMDLEAEYGPNHAIIGSEQGL